MSRRSPGASSFGDPRSSFTRGFSSSLSPAAQPSSPSETRSGSVAKEKRRASESPLSASRSSLFEVSVRPKDVEEHRKKNIDKNHRRSSSNPSGGVSPEPKSVVKEQKESFETQRHSKHTQWVTTNTTDGTIVTSDGSFTSMELPRQGRVASLVQKFQARDVAKGQHPKVTEVVTTVSPYGRRIVTSQPVDSDEPTVAATKHRDPSKRASKGKRTPPQRKSSSPQKLKGPPEPAPVQVTPPTVTAEAYKELLKLGSNLSDDGYNVVAPIAAVQPPSCDTSRAGSVVGSIDALLLDGADVEHKGTSSFSTVSKPKKLSMYDWAVLAQQDESAQSGSGRPGTGSGDASSESLTRSMSQKSSKTIRLIPTEQVNRGSRHPGINIFVGTWNTEYGEFPLEAMLSSAAEPASEVASLPTVENHVISTGRTVGVDEEISEQLRMKVRLEKNLGMAEEALQATENVSNGVRSKRRSSIQKPQDPAEGSDASATGSADIERPRALSRHAKADSLGKTAMQSNRSGTEDGATWSESDAEGDTITDNVDALREFRRLNPPPTKKHVLQEKVYQPLPDNREPLANWITPGYDVYVIALQEVISDRLFDAILIYLNRVNKKPFRKLEFTEDKISGLGDGAYLSMKSTAISCFVAEELVGPSKPVNVGSSKGMSLSSLNGSKGAVVIILTIYDQVICFVSCHLPAGKPDARLKARDLIRRRLAETFCGFPDVSPTDVFHHIIWAGDFNLRIRELPASVVLDYLYQNNPKPVLAFDEFEYSEYNSDFREDGFEEPPLQFYPTYKKIVGRGPTSSSDPYWLHKEYNVNFKVRWYKGGKVKERVPSWTDRIFKWSHAALRSCLVFLPNTYCSASPEFDTILLASDHNPVGTGLRLFALSSQYKIPPVMFHETREHKKRRKKQANVLTTASPGNGSDEPSLASSSISPSSPAAS